MSEEAKKSETNPGLRIIYIKDVLKDNAFNVSGDILFATPIDQSKLTNWYPNFNLKGLDSEGKWTMYYLVEKLSKAIEYAAELRSQGKSSLADNLIEKLRIVGDPNVSKTTDLNGLFKSTGGDIELCLAFLGLSKNEGAKKWIDFIIRTWGEQPVYNFR